MGSNRIAILILGMHRSGTSAIAGSLAQLGVAVPKTLLPPREFNPRGFWESARLMKFNDRLLTRMGSAWSEWGRLDFGSLSDYERSAIKDDLVQALNHEFGDAQLAMIKDPRICRLMPLWLEALSETGFQVRVILAVRPPLDVAASLAKRNGIGHVHSMLLWLRYVLDAEVHSRPLVRTQVSYDDLLADWRPVICAIASDLGVRLQWSDANRARAVDEFLSADLRHGHVGGKTSPVSTLTTLAQEVAQTLSDVRHAPMNIPVQERLADISKQLDLAHEVYMGLEREANSGTS